MTGNAIKYYVALPQIPRAGRRKTWSISDYRCGPSEAHWDAHFAVLLCDGYGEVPYPVVVLSLEQQWPHLLCRGGSWVL